MSPGPFPTCEATITWAEPLPWDLVAGERAEVSSPPSRELHWALSITHVSPMKKARPRWTSQCVRARPQLSHCAAAPTPSPPHTQGAGGRPQGPKPSHLTWVLRLTPCPHAG